ncbi:hypothetical protein [Curtobacterium sp. 9128]|uniref:hypothetical protein n=1 Tax=Curtobacterium sp. 9128 TaxID=1793722 RepID=UPI0011A0FFF0|nr:hypothetical protein [Curtobacterium sp. 9128]
MLDDDPCSQPDELSFAVVELDQEVTASIEQPGARTFDLCLAALSLADQPVCDIVGQPDRQSAPPRVDVRECVDLLRSSLTTDDSQRDRP